MQNEDMPTREQTPAEHAEMMASARFESETIKSIIDHPVFLSDYPEAVRKFLIDRQYLCASIVALGH